MTTGVSVNYSQLKRMENVLLTLVASIPSGTEQLLSTAMLTTPKSTQGPLFGSGVDLDQSLHHIDACIKSPLDFGSPQIE